MRQYIGARYVPKFEGTWSGSRTYEALSVVDYNGDSYTSKKPVPVGIAPTNGTYWALTGAYNSQMSQLQTELSEVKDTLTANRINPSEYAIFIGDSYVGAASLGANIGERFSTQVCSMLGLTEKNYAVGGCGYVEGATPYADQLDLAINEFTSGGIDTDLVKYVFVMGSRNDHLELSTTESQLLNAAKDLFRDINTNFPKAMLVVAPLLWDFHNVTVHAQRNIRVIKDALVYAKNVLVIDNMDILFCGRMDEIMYQSGANVHYNVFGHYRAAEFVINVINGGSGFTPCSNKNFASFLDGTSNAVNVDIRDIVANGGLHITGALTVSANLSAGDPIATFTIAGQNVHEYMFPNKSRGFAFNVSTGAVVPLTLKNTITKTGDTLADQTYVIELDAEAAISSGATLVLTFDNIYGYNNE